MSEETKEQVEQLPRKTWKVDSTFDNYREADKKRKTLLQKGKKAKVRHRADGSFDVKVVVK